MPAMPSPAHLPASVETCHWGAFDATLPPVMTVASGQRFTVATVSGGAAVLPPAGFHVPPELLDIHARSPMLAPGHILTGPVAVEGAMPGDMLEVRIVDVQLRQDWGYNVIRPLAGTLPEDFDAYRHLNIPLDAERMVARLPWGLDLPLHPFFGVMGVAPPPHWGASARSSRARMAATSTTRSSGPAVRCTCRCTCRVRCSPAATAMAYRATARSASPRSKPHCIGTLPN